jgi:magnesium-protoporphyrin O-methyltransferase
VDISPSLVEIAGKRLPDSLYHQVTYHVGDMLDPALGEFDHVVAMDSLIYYDAADINRSISTLLQRTGGKIVFTVAPRTPFLMAFFGMGKLFPRRDRSPIMIPHAPKKLARLVDANLRSVARISSGFYISECLEVTK